jgi:iron complex transport system substrate-binding protein
VAAGLVALGACAAPVSAPSPTTSPTASAAPTTPAQAAAYPVVIDNCGFSVRLDQAPQRVVALKSAPVELMLALGLGDRIVGTAYLDGPIPDGLGAAPDAVANPLSDKLPSLEAVLALEPDLVFAGWESMVSAEGLAARDRLERLGVATYVSPAACREDPYRPVPLTIETVFAEFVEVGAIFGVPELADRLVTDGRAELAAATPLAEAPTALWWSSATDIPYVGAGAGAPQLIMSAAGLVNVAESVRDTWTSLSWEEIVAADPDLFVLVDADWNTAAHKAEALRDMPATRGLDAVREERYVIVPFAATQGGPRTTWAVGEVVRQARALGLR